MPVSVWLIFGTLTAYIVAVMIVAVKCFSRSSWLCRVEKDFALFRMPKIYSAIPVLLLVVPMFFMFGVMLYSQVQDDIKHPAQAVSDYGAMGVMALLIGTITSAICWVSAPTELEVDLPQRRYRHTKRWFPTSQVTRGTLEDFSGISSSHSGGVILVFRVRRGLPYGYTLGAYGDTEKAAAGAQEMADLLGLPIVPVPWR